MEKNNYFIDIEKQVLLKNKEVISNRKYTEMFSLKELETYIFSDVIQKVFICSHETTTRGYLSKLLLGEIKMEWNERYKKNISFNDEVYLEDFPGEYCFFVELWEGEGEEKILVLYEQH